MKRAQRNQAGVQPRRGSLSEKQSLRNRKKQSVNFHHTMSLSERWEYGQVVPKSNGFEQMLKSNHEGSPGDREIATHSLKLQQGTQYLHFET